MINYSLSYSQCIVILFFFDVYASLFSKAEKDWTRRIGNERHLICIEDPFEISHDLGRVVDKYSIRALREEFQRAARIMRDTEPWVRLFKPFVRQQVEDDALENQTI